jgi:hypothetical protein
MAHAISDTFMDGSDDETLVECPVGNPFQEIACLEADKPIWDARSHFLHTLEIRIRMINDECRHLVTTLETGIKHWVRRLQDVRKEL